MSVFTRSFPLDDVTVRDGRTVDAYAAVFDVEAEVRDQDGHYLEAIHRAAFDRSIAQRGTRVGVFYNHGKTLYGTPSDRNSVPIGVCEEIRTDSKGLFTRTRYTDTPLADEILESIRARAIVAQSFTGRFLTSDKKTPKYGFRADANGALTRVTRTEIGLIEYGPTPLPNYETADIVAVRATDLLTAVSEMDDAQRAEFAARLNLPAARLQSLAADGTATDGPAENDETPALMEHARSHPKEVADAAAQILGRKLPWQ